MCWLTSRDWPANSAAEQTKMHLGLHEPIWSISPQRVSSIGDLMVEGITTGWFFGVRISGACLVKTAREERKRYGGTTTGRLIVSSARVERSIAQLRCLMKAITP